MLYIFLDADGSGAYFLRHATGGQIPGVLPRLSDAELNVTLSQNNTGNVSDARTHFCERNTDRSLINRCSKSSLTWTLILLAAVASIPSR